MKIKKLDAHDRLLHFNNQSDLISQGCSECIKKRPEAFGNHPFYIFCHSRSIELDERLSIFNQDHAQSLVNPMYSRQYKSLSQVPTCRFIWSPRLTKPRPQENSMLFKAYPPGDNIKIIWIIPAKEMWSQYKKGNMTESQVIVESIYKFQTNPKELAEKEEDDLPDSIIDKIFEEIKLENNLKPLTKA